MKIGGILWVMKLKVRKHHQTWTRRNNELIPQMMRVREYWTSTDAIMTLG